MSEIMSIQEAIIEEMDNEALVGLDKDGEMIDLVMGAIPYDYSAEEELPDEEEALLEAVENMYVPESIF